jgi:hypothetical protein
MAQDDGHVHGLPILHATHTCITIGPHIHFRLFYYLPSGVDASHKRPILRLAVGESSISIRQRHTSEGLKVERTVWDTGDSGQRFLGNAIDHHQRAVEMMWVRVEIPAGSLRVTWQSFEIRPNSSLILF